MRVTRNLRELFEIVKAYLDGLRFQPPIRLGAARKSF